MFADVKRMGHSQQARHRQREQAFLDQQETTARNHRNDNITRLGATMEDRAQTKRWVQQQHAQQQELEMERAILEEKAIREAQAKKEAQETALAAELARQKTLKMRDEKMRQRVREESEEIRQLRSQLEAAYTNREREKQVAEKRQIYERELDEEVQFIAETQRELEAHAESAKYVEERKAAETARYKQELEAQVVAQKRSRRKSLY
ncbi:unnamed protein product [Oikopleura dioica]|uniref:Meiosis-specific nuclear structural protein 1 n=1 Tax=Oikopleura dioica TaxID=34765 RepID=E4WX05_OIKDI|nr:unnamed protein product [Oikopleura dioica]